MDIHSLLNPSACEQGSYRSSQTPALPSGRSATPSPPDGAPEKPRKDAMILIEGSKANGPINYPPHRANGDEKIAAMHQEFSLDPLGNIGDYYRHIPYKSSSNDRQFAKKTQRAAFEVFQYSYKMPGDKKEWVVVWDYNIGLVRMTPLFKSLGHGKVVPRKALEKNKGLLDVCYSITGGALTAQGYWVPYLAAKALAATFCYDIRYVLTPVFGNDFPSLCLLPNNKSFKSFKIDPVVVTACIAETARWKDQHNKGTVTSSSPPASKEQCKAALASPLSDQKKLRPRRKKAEMDLESGYGTDTSRSDKPDFSPEVSPRTQTWNAINITRSPTGPPRSSPFISHLPAVPSTIPPIEFTRRHALRPPMEDEHSDAPYYRKTAVADDEAEVSATSASYHANPCDEYASQYPPHFTAEDIEAVHILLSMSRSGR